MYFEQSLWVWNPYTYTAATVDYGLPVSLALVALGCPHGRSDAMEGHVLPIFFTPKELHNSIWEKPLSI